MIATLLPAAFQRSLDVTTLVYQQTSDHFMAQASEDLAVGDLQQASEKGWDAAVQMLKAMASERG